MSESEQNNLTPPADQNQETPENQARKPAALLITAEDANDEAPQPNSKPKPEAGKPAAPAARKNAPKAGKTAGGGGKVLGLLAIIIALAVGFVGYGQLQTLKSALEESVAKQQQTLQKSDPSKKFDVFKINIGNRFDSLKQEQQSNAAKLTKLQESVTQQLGKQNHSQRDWQLAEVRYLLNMANTRLRLLRDVNTAAEALKTADARLAELNEPALFGVRESIAREIADLQSVGNLDGSSVALKLMSLGKLIGDLPPAKLVVSQDQSVDEGQSSALKEGVVADVARWLGVRRANRAYKVLPQEPQVFYIDQLMRLELEAARHAVLRFDEQTYTAHINAATVLLKENYQQSDARVAKALADLRELSARNVFVPLPDISGSSSQLQRALARYDGTAGAAKE